MILRLFCLLICVCCWSEGAVWGDLGLQDVRMAHADVDGDGIAEVIVGGRIGPAVAADVPRMARTAGVGVYREDRGMLTPLYERGDLHVVADVAGGDVDGDGMDEVVVVGMGQVTILDVIDGQLVVGTRFELAHEWTDRVMVDDVDGDGVLEVGVTLYHIAPDMERGQSEVVFGQIVNQAFHKKFNFAFNGHIGDLCGIKAGDGQVFVALEVGMGDEGGDVYVISGRTGDRVWHGALTLERVRALYLDAQAPFLAVGGVDGRIWQARMTPDGFVSSPHLLQHLVGVSGLVWMPDKRLLLSHRTGLHVLRY